MNQETSKPKRKLSSDVVRKNIWLVYLILLNIIIRIPRTEGLLGADSFSVIAIGSIISEGYIEFFFISPFSIFGLYSYGSYPIGLPLIVGAMISSGLSYEIIVLIISLVCGFIGTVGAYYLGKQLFEVSEYVILFTAFYSLSHIFYRFTFYSISARGPFLAVLPWFLFFSIKFLRERSYKWAMSSGVSLFILSLFHGLTVFVILYLGVVIAYYLVHHIGGFHSFRNLKERFSGSSQVLKHSQVWGAMYWILLLILLLGSLWVGTQTFYIDVDKISAVFSNNTFFGLTLNLVIDYGLRLGVLSIFFPLGIISIFSNYRNHPIIIAHFIMLCLVMFTIPKSLYGSVLFLPVFGYYSVIGFAEVRKRVSTFWLSGLLSGFVLVFTLLYNSLVVSLFSWIMILAAVPIILFCAGLFGFVKRRTSPFNTRGVQIKYGMHLVILSIVVFSLVTTEGLNLQGNYNFLSDGEKQIIEYLRIPENTGLTFVFAPLVAVHIAAYRIPTIPMGDGIETLYYGLANSSDIVANTQFDLVEIFRSGKLFRYEGDMPGDAVYNTLFGVDLTDPLQYELAITTGLQYVVVEKDYSGYSDVYQSGTESIYCRLLDTAPDACELVFDTEAMSLFRLYP